MEATAFASIRKLNANFVADTVNNEDYISSFLNSGYNVLPARLMIKIISTSLLSVET
jgi:hypothetical protein